MSGFLYQANQARNEDLLRAGERQRTAAAVATTKEREPAQSSPRVVTWPFRQVARVARLGRAASPAG